MAALTAAAIATAVIAAGTSAYEIKSSSDARSDAKDQMNKQANDQNKLMADAQQKTNDANAANASTMAADQASRRDRALANSIGTHNGTVLTSPLGVTTPPQTANKTLLGM
jgi:hypothetical protein